MRNFNFSHSKHIAILPLLLMSAGKHFLFKPRNTLSYTINVLAILSLTAKHVNGVMRSQHKGGGRYGLQDGITGVQLIYFFVKHSNQKFVRAHTKVIFGWKTTEATDTDFPQPMRVVRNRTYLQQSLHWEFPSYARNYYKEI